MIEAPVLRPVFLIGMAEMSWAWCLPPEPAQNTTTRPRTLHRPTWRIDEVP